MLRISLIALACLLAPLAQAADMPKVAIHTSKGVITLELNDEAAPKSVKNFLRYVEADFYDGTVFHRVISNFMVQGGGFDAELRKKSTFEPIPNEADNGLSNDRGTIAMARTSDPHSATAQFYINHADNHFLNHTGKNPRGWGYAVFGKVISGLDVVDAIAAVKTGAKPPFRSDVPLETVLIERIERVGDAPAEGDGDAG